MIACCLEVLLNCCKFVTVAIAFVNFACKIGQIPMIFMTFIDCWCRTCKIAFLTIVNYSDCSYEIIASIYYPWHCCIQVYSYNITFVFISFKTTTTFISSSIYLLESPFIFPTISFCDFTQSVAYINSLGLIVILDQFSSIGFLKIDEIDASYWRIKAITSLAVIFCSFTSIFKYMRFGIVNYVIN